jgi:hypothetical protein
VLVLVLVLALALVLVLALALALALLQVLPGGARVGWVGGAGGEPKQAQGG